MEQVGLTLFEACRRDFVIPEEVLDLGTTNAEVRRIRKKDIINGFLQKYHYLHKCGTTKPLALLTRAYGLYLGGELCSVVVYNPPGSMAVAAHLFGNGYSAAENRLGTLALSRLVSAPDAPFNATGFLICHSQKELWEDNKERRQFGEAEFRTVISFADLMFHSGTVYRAANAWYAGVTKNTGLGGFFNPVTGHHIHTRQGKITLKKTDCPDGYIPFKASDKLRYLFFIGRKKEKLQTMRSLSPEIKVACREGKISFLKEGRLANLSDSRSYEEVYHMVNGRGTSKAENYLDYLKRLAY